MDNNRSFTSTKPSYSTILPFRSFISSKVISLSFLLILLAYAAFVLYMVDASILFIFFTVGGFFILMLLWLLVSYLYYRRRLRLLSEQLDQLPEQYLAGELIEAPVNAVEKEYFDIMRRISRSAIGTVEQAKREKQEYCDYVESWVHEIKTPLTACSLILDNDADRDKLRRELKRADNQTENILYYARLRTVEKDLQISPVHIRALLEDALHQEMELLIAAGISAEVEGDFTVNTDPKLLSFIVKQLLINCAKYCTGCHIQMTATDNCITIEDNGPGIPAHELPRITQRGFTGARWRAGNVTGSATNGSLTCSTGMGGTGMGLYIVSELCNKLNINLKIQSKEGEYTRFLFHFQ